MLDVDDGPRQLAEGGHQPGHVGRVLPNRRLVEHVQHILESARERDGESHALRFTPGERRRGAVEGDVAQPDGVQGVQASLDLLLDTRGGGRQVRFCEARARPIDRAREQVGQAQPLPKDGCCRGVHTRSAAPVAALAAALGAGGVEMDRFQIAEPRAATDAGGGPGERGLGAAGTAFPSCADRGRAEGSSGLDDGAGLHGGIAKLDPAHLDGDVVGLGRIERGWVRATCERTIIDVDGSRAQLGYQEAKERAVTARHA